MSDDGTLGWGVLVTAPDGRRWIAQGVHDDQRTAITARDRLADEWWPTSKVRVVELVDPGTWTPDDDDRMLVEDSP